MKLILPVFQHTDKSMKLEDNGLDYSVDDMVIVSRTFYNIDNVADYYENGKMYTLIMSSGEDHISPLPRCEIEELIDEQSNGIRIRMHPN